MKACVLSRAPRFQDTPCAFDRLEDPLRALEDLLPTVGTKAAEALSAQVDLHHMLEGVK